MENNEIIELLLEAAEVLDEDAANRYYTKKKVALDKQYRNALDASKKNEDNQEKLLKLDSALHFKDPGYRKNIATFAKQEGIKKGLTSKRTLDNIGEELASRRVENNKNKHEAEKGLAKMPSAYHYRHLGKDGNYYDTFSYRKLVTEATKVRMAEILQEAAQILTEADQSQDPKNQKTNLLNKLKKPVVTDALKDELQKHIDSCNNKVSLEDLESGAWKNK